ncbi:MFS transporter [Gilvimarinus sp. SDUM040013]|uniref:MFS transporter n=1 Tax=Gilvimarinus gilvus TaxID=3058038 RepID=A0ABU4RZL5_9GAMM|nr:MFS transporter [Gilvimarinus sp. SDUM040013]MDO3386112.1 MFS transporter [Gilvimarinus sp. SDUM040013]MDX6850347.1 MFS transporter [Gilvimarinus sp. SDUM040013]
MPSDPALHANQFALLKQRKFYPLFWTQFGGAFNDNFYKSALMMLFTYGAIERWGLSVDVLNNLVAAALIIPFLLFAPIAGQYVDSLDKARVARVIKLGEVAVMLLGAVAMWLGSSALLLLVIFATGVQSACFSPVKYAILPQHVEAKQLTGANGVLHSGTSLAVFAGLICGTLILQVSGGQLVVAVGGVLVAWAGWRFSRHIPAAPASSDASPVVRNPLRLMQRTVGYASENKTVFWSIVGFSWYWFLGSVYLTQLPNFARTVLMGQASSVTFLLVAFLFGVCGGALLCEKLSRKQLEPALVPLGGILIAVLGFDIALAGQSFYARYQLDTTEQLFTLGQLLTKLEFWRVAMDVLLLGIAGGLYSVPLQALMQHHARNERRGQIIAANNVFNALFMIASSISAVVFLGQLDFTIPHFFMLTVALHLTVLLLLLWREPVFFQRVKLRVNELIIRPTS